MMIGHQDRAVELEVNKLHKCISVLGMLLCSINEVQAVFKGE